jgi:hypothetical protein
MLVSTTCRMSSKFWSKKAFPRPRPALASSASTGPAFRRDIEHVEAFDRGEIGFDRVHPHASRTEIVRRIGDGRFVGDDQKVEAILGTLPGELVSDAARGAGDDCEGTAV